MRRLGIAGQLWFQVLVGTLLGILLGYLAPGAAVAMKPLGDLFIKLIRMMIGPVIFVTVVHGIAGMNDMRSVGRLALKSILYFEAITIVALVFGLVAVDLWRPGAGMNINAALLDASSVKGYVATAHHQSIAGYLLDIVPTTFASSLTDDKVLQVLFVSVLFGIAIASTGERGRPVIDLVESASQAFFRIIGYVMYVAPIGAFGAIAFTVGQFGTASLLSLGELIVEFLVVCLAFTFIVLGGVAYWCGVNLWRLMGYIRDEIVIVAATTSTEDGAAAVDSEAAQAGLRGERGGVRHSGGLFVQPRRHLPVLDHGGGVPGTSDQHPPDAVARTGADRGAAADQQGRGRGGRGGVRGAGGDAVDQRGDPRRQHRADPRHPPHPGRRTDLRKPDRQQRCDDCYRQMGRQARRTDAGGGSRHQWIAAAPVAVNFFRTVSR